MVPAAVVVANLPDKPCAMVQQTDTDHVYECVGVSSAPECDMDRHRTSLQYSSAGSETESDIYYPYVTFQVWFYTYTLVLLDSKLIET